MQPWSWEEAKAHRDATTHVYFVEGAGLIKIGFAVRPIDRFCTMLTSCPIPLSLLASMPGGPTVENQLHRRFVDYRSHGEWFRPSPELDAIIKAAPHQYGAEYQSCRASLARKGAIPEAIRREAEECLQVERKRPYG